MVKVRLLKTVKIILLWLICLLTGYFFYHLVDCKFNPNFWTNLSA
ncbi:putative DNA topoisomerase [Lactiplantibacillus plantarum]|nr:putative DNA topoisomerase [Lactiplantibacillus plantarum]